MSSPATDKVLFLSDIHFWEIVVDPRKLLNKRLLGSANVYFRRRHEFHMENALPFAREVAATGVTTAILGGDFTSTATDAEFQRGAALAQDLAGQGLDLLVFPGNHDVYTFEALRKKRFEHYLGAFPPHDALPCREALPNGTPVVLAPTVVPNLLSSRGRITPEEIETTQRLVAEAPEGPVLVAAHYPVLEDTPWFTTAKSRRLRNAAAFRQALGDTGRHILYLCGHAHRHGYIQDDRHPKLLHLCTGAFLLQRHGSDESGEFSEIHVHPDRFEIFRHLHRDGQWTRSCVEAKHF